MGLENDSWSSWYENGQKDQGVYNNGLMSNNWEGWYPNGQMDIVAIMMKI